MKSFTHQVKISIEGFGINRLLNKANTEEIKLKGVKFESNIKIHCYIACDDLKRIRALAGTLYRIQVVENTGIGYKMKMLLKRPFEIAFVFITFMIVISQSYFVKTIEIQGYRGIPETDIRHCLAEVGIEEGSFIPKINWREAERHIYDVFPEVTWLRLVYDGRKIFLNISEGDVLDETNIQDEDWQVNSKYYCNIISDKEGYIESINTYRGLALVEEGDYVEKGQILILGCVPIRKKYHPDAQPDREYLVKSAGEISAIIPYRLTFEQGLYDETGKVKSKKQIEEKLGQQLRQWTKENLPENAEILNKDLNFCYKENIIEISVTLEIRGQIGEEQEIVIGQKN